MTAQGPPPPSLLIASFVLTRDKIEEIKGTAAAHGALYLSAFVASSAELLGTEQAGEAWGVCAMGGWSTSKSPLRSGVGLEST